MRWAKRLWCGRAIAIIRLNIRPCIARSRPEPCYPTALAPPRLHTSTASHAASRGRASALLLSRVRARVRHAAGNRYVTSYAPVYARDFDSPGGPNRAQVQAIASACFSHFMPRDYALGIAKKSAEISKFQAGRFSNTDVAK